MEQILKILTSQALGNGVLLLIALTLYLVILFRKALFRQLAAECGLATKEDLTHALYGLRTELNAKMDAQHREIVALSRQLDSLKSNDLFHIAKANLLHARETVNDPESFERIKDNLLEAVPDNQKAQLENINFINKNSSL